MEVRKNENDKHWYRSDRFFKANGEWFFSTREQNDIGPFGSEAAAKRGLDLYIKMMQAETLSQRAAMGIAKNGEWAQTLYH